jgi:HK97 family phage prohead protease
MKLKHKSFPIKIECKDDASRTVEGWASTFGNKDSYGDIVVSGAFIESLKTKMPKMLYQHNSDQPVGVWTAATETPQGLYVKGELLDTMLGNDVYKMLKAGAISDMSIGYQTIESDYDSQSDTRMLRKLKLWEVSLVTFPANDQANITMVKAAMEDIDAAGDLLEQVASMCDAYASGDMQPTAETLSTVSQMIRQAMTLLSDEGDEPDEGKSAKLTPKQIERILREAGMSRGDARGVIAKGYTAIVAPREADGQELNRLYNLFNQMKL